MRGFCETIATPAVGQECVARAPWPGLVLHVSTLVSVRQGEQ